MPKMKTKSGAKKRFKLMGSGKIKRKSAFRRHLNDHKPSKRTRRLRAQALVHKSDERAVKRMLLA